MLSIPTRFELGKGQIKSNKHIPLGRRVRYLHTQPNMLCFAVSGELSVDFSIVTDSVLSQPPNPNSQLDTYGNHLFSLAESYFIDWSSLSNSGYPHIYNPPSLHKVLFFRVLMLQRELFV